VKSGILRVFALSEDGKEITQWLSTKDFFITDVMGFSLINPIGGRYRLLLKPNYLPFPKQII
jgi:hypothetical protein